MSTSVQFGESKDNRKNEKVSNHSKVIDKRVNYILKFSKKKLYIY